MGDAKNSTKNLDPSTSSEKKINKKATVVQEVKNIYQYHQRSTREFAVHDFNAVYKKTLEDLSVFGLESIKEKEILDIGCGARFPFSLLASSAGANLTALDTSYVKPHMLPIFFWKIFRANGMKRAAKSTLRKLLFDKIYLKQLEASAGIGLSQFVPKINFILADATAKDYPLPSDKYDLITSNAVLEHVNDIRKYFTEVKRLLKKGGLTYGHIHNYYSISGGHNLQWAFPDTAPPPGVEPWDHLRKNRFPTHIYLNKLKPADYKGAASAAGLELLLFEGRDINHNSGGLEGEKLLTPEVQKDLSEYPRELLLTRSYCIICRKL